MARTGPLRLSGSLLDGEVVNALLAEDREANQPDPDRPGLTQSQAIKNGIGPVMFADPTAQTAFEALFPQWQTIIPAAYKASLAESISVLNGALKALELLISEWDSITPPLSAQRLHQLDRDHLTLVHRSYMQMLANRQTIMNYGAVPQLDKQEARIRLLEEQAALNRAREEFCALSAKVGHVC